MKTGLMVPPGFVHPDQIEIALKSRRDIFRLLVPENPLLEAYGLLHQIGELIDRYNALAEATIKDAGFHQFPHVDLIGYDTAENGDSCPSGFYYLDMNKVVGLCREDPKPLHSYLARVEHEEKMAAERQSTVRRKKAKITATVAERLGRTPAEWICAYCERPGTAEYGPDGRVWHVDHRYPRVFGGDNQKDNLVLSCATCNMSKGGRTEREFTRAREKNA